MVTKSKTYAGFQCHACGKVQIRELSAFDFGGESPNTIVCENCNQPFATLKGIDKENYELQAVCLDCYTTHSFKVKKGLFWKTPLKEFNCRETEELIMAVGEGENIKKLLEEEFYLDDKDSQMPRLEMEDVKTISVLMDVIEHLKALGDKGRVVCRCKSPRIKIELDSDFLELVCEDCGNSVAIDFADTKAMEEILKNSKIEF